ncbi:type VII secretion-associated serine protease mycosin [Pseudonocardia sp. ICBG1122]|nr:type VII secretion-associated serine protease mycosin [Pseudonocardia pini]
MAQRPSASSARWSGVAVGLLLLLASLVTALAGPGAAVALAAQADVGPQPCLGAPPRIDPSVPWAQSALGADRVWPLTRGAGVTVAVVDTGVDAATPQLAGGRVLPGVDVSSTPTPSAAGRADSDCPGHGTFVAGIVAAAPMAGAGFVGVAPDAEILPVRVTAAGGGDGSLTTASLAAGIRVAVDLGARVINVSASTDVNDPQLEAAVRDAVARDAVVVASAANGARSGDAVTYPASYPEVLAVGAVDAAGRHAEFSETGPYLGLVAPGVDVVSIGPGGAGQWRGSGTSYAAPFVAGSAALVRAYHPELDATQVKHRLEVTADHPPGTLPDPALGWGMVNPLAAVTAVLPEENGDPSRLVVGPPPARPGPAPPAAGAGPVVAALGAVLAALIMGATVFTARLGRSGHRRGWKPARIAEVSNGAPVASGRGR